MRLVVSYFKYQNIFKHLLQTAVLVGIAVSSLYSLTLLLLLRLEKHYFVFSFGFGGGTKLVLFIGLTLFWPTFYIKISINQLLGLFGSRESY